jgi:hypothetical protein
VSERAEDPVYVLEHGLPIDCEYYLDKHVRSTFLRVFAPIWRHRMRQQRLDQHTTQYKTAVEMSELDREQAAAEYLFGHVREYRDVGAAEFVGIDIMPVTAKIDAEETEKLVTEGRIGVVPLHNARSKSALVQVRYAPPRLVDSLASQNTTVQTKNTQTSIFGFGTAGARCRACKQFHAGQKNGFVCATCIATAPPKEIETDVYSCLRDIEDLRCERSEIAATCHACMGCGDAPKHITCTNSDCPTFWQRKNNQQSERTVANKLVRSRAMVYESGQIERLKF